MSKSGEQRIPGRAYKAGVGADAPLFVAPLSVPYTKSVNTKEMSVTAVLSWPTPDLAGDEVKADGGDWSQHKAFPWAGLEHYRYHTSDRNQVGLIGQPGVGHEPVVVGWCRKSLSEPGADYEVVIRRFTIDGETHDLPIATTYFDRDDKLSAQTFAMTERGALPGVSMEFTPVLKARRQRLAQSPLERRPAFFFDRWIGLGYVHCAIPVNPGALVCKSHAAADMLVRALTDKRVGSERMHPVIFKSLSRYLPEHTRSTVHVHLEKAMPTDPMGDAQTAYDDPNAAGADAADVPTDDAPPLNGVAASYAKVQRIIDSCDEYESDMTASDSPELRGGAAKMIAKLKAIAEQIKGMADKHDAKLNAKPADPTAEPTEGADTGDESDDEEDDEDPDMSTDDDGVLKAVRPCYHKALAARRLTLAEVRKAQPVNAQTVNAQAAGEDSAEDIAYLEAMLARDDKADKKLNRVKRYA